MRAILDWMRNHKIWSVLLFLVVLGVIGNFLPEPPQDSHHTSSPTTTTTVSPEQRAVNQALDLKAYEIAKQMSRADVRKVCLAVAQLGYDAAEEAFMEGWGRGDALGRNVFATMTLECP